MALILSIFLSIIFNVNDCIGSVSQFHKLSGYTLKTALAESLSAKHIERGYHELYQIFLVSDIDQQYEKDGSILDIYSEVPNGKDPYVYKGLRNSCGNYQMESDCFNREHLFPQNIFNYEYPMKSDFHHVFPTDGVVNGKRKNYPFGDVSDPLWSSQNGSLLGMSQSKEYSGTVFEPLDEFKGDVARAFFYFATRYEKRIKHWNDDILNGTSGQVYSKWFLRTLLKWHKNDPVSLRERHRNNIGEKFQGNRNPFIDNPQWVNKIWSL